MRKMEQKVFSGSAMVNRKQVAVIVAASSQRAAVAALHGVGIDVTVRQLASYWPLTGNAHERATALAAPGEVFAASSKGGNDYDFKALPKLPLVKPSTPPEPKVPKDREGRKAYDKERREASDTGKRERGEVRVSSWLPPDAAAALHTLTGGKKTRGAVQAALVLALTTCAASQPVKKDAPKAA